MAVSHHQRGSEVRFEQRHPRFGPFGPRPLVGFGDGEAISLRHK